jgi:hypothetical protein
MKSETVTAVMVLALFVSALAAVWISARWFFSVKEVQDLQAQQARITNTRVAAQALANDVIQYGNKNPRIEPLLAEFNLRGPTNQVPAKSPMK